MNAQIENKPLLTLYKIGIILGLLMGISGTLFILDALLNNSYYFNKLRYTPDCNYVTPSGYAIYYSKDRNKYAVKVLQFQDYYLYNGTRGITTIFTNIAEPSLFGDSCTAKAYLKAYIKEQQPKFK